MPIHLHPTAPLAERVLLPGDPGRALQLAQTLIDGPRMFNHNRGLWGYSGPALLDGRPLTIQATGMGGPSAAIVISELAELGARTMLRVGTCGAIAPDCALGEILVVAAALAGDGTSRALGAGERVAGSPQLLDRGIGAGIRATVTATTDVFYEPRPDREVRWLRAGASVVEMETATLFALGARLGLATGSLLAVSDRLGPTRHRIGDEGLRDAERRLGELAMRMLVTGG
jgi:uridine phosphorylase